MAVFRTIDVDESYPRSIFGLAANAAGNLAGCEPNAHY